MIKKFKERQKGESFQRCRIAPEVGDLVEVELLDGTKSVFTAVGDNEYMSCRYCDGNLSSPGESDMCIALICNFTCPGSIILKSIDKVMEDL